MELDFAHRSLKRELYQLESWSRKDFIGLLTKIYSVLLCQMTTNSNNEEDLNDPESLNYMFNHQGSATQDTRGFGDINGSFGTDGAAMLDNGSTEPTFQIVHNSSLAISSPIQTVSSLLAMLAKRVTQDFFW